MAVKTFGTIEFDKAANRFHLFEVEPHVSMKLKSIFGKIRKSDIEYYFHNDADNCNDLLWFFTRYPFKMDAEVSYILKKGKEAHEYAMQVFESLFAPNYTPKQVKLKDGLEARDYQLTVREFHKLRKRTLLGDDLGLGKTLSAILTFDEETLPAIVVVQSHLKNQWKKEIQKFTNLGVVIINGTKPFNLPAADVYIINYTCITGWVNYLINMNLRSVVFDEVQELRRVGSNKYESAERLTSAINFCMGMSATPIYNYGDEMYNVLNVINADCLGSRDDFYREWCTRYGMHYKVDNPSALGTHLRESYLFLRRTREDVKRELPPVNIIVYTVEHDEHAVKSAAELAEMLAIKATSGTFVERGQAARDLDIMVRHLTGVSKAKQVAEWVKLFLSSGEPVVLGGWHRDVYEIWKEELKEFNPVFYTGSESTSQKDKAKEMFITGETNLLILSLRSGIGLDGLQHRCHNIVIGELDYSPKVHEQFIARVDRDMQKEQVNAFFLVSEFGSDPVMLDMLGLKSSQAHGINDPLALPKDQHSDETYIQKLAQSFLKKQTDLFNKELNL